MKTVILQKSGKRLLITGTLVLTHKIKIINLFLAWD